MFILWIILSWKNGNVEMFWTWNWLVVPNNFSSDPEISDIIGSFCELGSLREHFAATFSGIIIICIRVELDLGNISVTSVGSKPSLIAFITVWNNRLSVFENENQFSESLLIL